MVRSPKVNLLTTEGAIYFEVVTDSKTDLNADSYSFDEAIDKAFTYDMYFTFENAGIDLQVDTVHTFVTTILSVLEIGKNCQSSFQA